MQRFVLPPLLVPFLGTCVPAQIVDSEDRRRAPNTPGRSGQLDVSGTLTRNNTRYPAGTGLRRRRGRTRLTELAQRPVHAKWLEYELLPGRHHAAKVREKSEPTRRTISKGLHPEMKTLTRRGTRIRTWGLLLPKQVR